MRKLKSHLLILVTAVSFILLPVAAEAQTASLSCAGAAVAGGELYAGGSSNGGACQFTGIQHIFSWIVCDYIGILNVVMGKAYCGIQYAVTPIVGALLTLYIAIFGVQVLMGTAQLRAGEVVVRLAKIAAVWTIVTQAAFGIGIAFEFFMGIIGQGAAWVLNFVMPNAGVTGTNTVAIYNTFDQFIYYTVVGSISQANSNVLGFFAAIGFIFPPIFSLALFWLITTLATLARTITSFLLGISAVAFLISMSPIFLSCMLFRVTYHLFESWLRYMTSYSVQIVISFAIVGMWIAVTSLFVGFFNDLQHMVFPYKNIYNAGVFVPSNTWAICSPPQYYIDIAGPEAACPGGTGFAPAADQTNLVPPSMIQQQQPNFLAYVTYHLLTLCIIGYAFLTLLHKAPNIAHDLVGPEQVPVIGQGWGSVSVGELNQGVRNVLGGAQQRDFGGVRDAVRSFGNQARDRMDLLLQRQNTSPGK